MEQGIVPLGKSAQLPALLEEVELLAAAEVELLAEEEEAAAELVEETEATELDSEVDDAALDAALDFQVYAALVEDEETSMNSAAALTIELVEVAAEEVVAADVVGATDTGAVYQLVAEGASSTASPTKTYFPDFKPSCTSAKEISFPLSM